VAASLAKLALFWDWLFYDKMKSENSTIMHIEPAILVMQHSMKPHMQITVSLLDFLVRVSYIVANLLKNIVFTLV